MSTIQITIANLNCGGCVKTITKKMLTEKGIENVNVDLDSSTVAISHNNNTNREIISLKLKALGYPEATDKNGLLTQLKSVKSCMSGKLSS